MALRNQPYLPLYIQDIMTDEKLNECSAATHGVFIKGIMCLMHKSETYGKILLKQKYKQTESKERSFALMLSKHLPYSVDVIFDALTELISEKVCHYEEDYLVQKRMVKDNELSEKRAFCGKLSGKNTQTKTRKFAKTKSQANSEYVNESEIKDENLCKGKEGPEEKPLDEPIIREMIKEFKNAFPKYPVDKNKDFPACLQISYKIGQEKHYNSLSVCSEGREYVLKRWGEIVKFVATDKWFAKKSLIQINNEWQSLIQSINSNGTNRQNNSKNGTTGTGIIFDRA
jgi:hypothetical protein